MTKCVSFVLVSGLVLCAKLLAVVIHRNSFWFFHDLDLGAGLDVDELVTTVINKNQAAGIDDAGLEPQIRHRDLVIRTQSTHLSEKTIQRCFGYSLDRAHIGYFPQPAIDFLLRLFEILDLHSRQTTGFDIPHHAFDFALGFGAVRTTGGFDKSPMPGQVLIGSSKYGPTFFISLFY